MKHRTSSRRHFVISQPTKLSSIDFEKFYDEVSRDWQGRARRLRNRRLEELRELEL